MFYILAYPRFAPTDFAAIEEYRAEFDRERARVVAPHLTLMFGTSALDELQARLLTMQIMQATSPFEIVFSERIIVQDPLDNSQKLFLVPSVGADKIARLHDEAYARLPAEELRADIPYAPHLTIATCDDMNAAEEAFGASERIPLPIGAMIEELTLVEVVDSSVRTIVGCPLSG